MQHADLTSIIEELAPLDLQEAYDNAGYIVGSASDECRGVLVCFDCTLDAVEYAIQRNCNLIVTHHPLIFHTEKKVITSSPQGAIIERLLQHKITHYAAHTNLDNTICGVNTIAQKLFKLDKCQVLKPKQGLFRKLVFYVPKVHEEKVREALFREGAGTIGNYTCCSFSSTGVGTFMPEDNASPHIGKRGELHKEEERRVEMVIPIWMQQSIIKTLVAVHPYEEVAYDIISLDNTFPLYGAGIVGDLPTPLLVSHLLEKLSVHFKVSHIRHSLYGEEKVERIAFCGGSGSSLISDAIAQGADIYITGDLTYHHFTDNVETPITLIDIGHKESEQHVVTLLHQLISAKLPNFAAHMYNEPYSIINTYSHL